MLQLQRRSWYDGHIVHFWRSSDGGFHETSSVAGADQGCASASLAYCAAVASPWEEAFQTLSGLDQGARMFLFSDDIKIWIDSGHLPVAYDSVSSALSQVGLCLSRSKTKVWAPAASVQIPDVPDVQRVRATVPWRPFGRRRPTKRSSSPRCRWRGVFST